MTDVPTEPAGKKTGLSTRTKLLVYLAVSYGLVLLGYLADGVIGGNIHFCAFCVVGESADSYRTFLFTCTAALVLWNSLGAWLISRGVSDPKWILISAVFGIPLGTCGLWLVMAYSVYTILVKPM